MGRFQPIIDLTTIETKLHKYNRPMTPEHKEFIYGILNEQSYIFFMSTMGVYCWNIVDQQIAKCAQGAGCLLRDSARGLYAIQIYNVKTSFLLCEQVISIDQIIILDIYDLMLLIVQSDGRALVLEFIDQTEVHSIRSVIAGIRTRGPYLDAPASIPRLLTESDILIISKVHEKPKKNISKVDISIPTDFQHVQHGGKKQFAVLTDNPKLKIGEIPLLNHMKHCPTPTPPVVLLEGCMNNCTNTDYTVPLMLQENPTNQAEENTLARKLTIRRAPPPSPPNEQKISLTCIINSTSNIQPKEPIHPLDEPVDDADTWTVKN